METFYVNLKVPSIGKIPIFLRQHGHGPKVLLVHGWMATSQTWQCLTEYMVPHYEVWALDLPAFGHTPAIPLPYTTLAFYAEILEKLINYISDGVGLHTLVGHSTGGLLVLLSLIKQRCLAKHIVVCGAPVTGLHSVTFLTAQADFVTKSLRAFRGIPMRLRKSLIALCQFFSFRSWYTAMREDTDMRDFDAPAAAAILKEVCACNLLDELQPCSANVLVTRGQRDPLTSHAAAVQLAETLCGTFYEFRCSGHSPMIEQPGHFSRILLQFLNNTSHVIRRSGCA